MRGIKEVLRLKGSCGLSERSIAQSCSLARSTVAKYLHRAQEAGLHWPLPDAMTEEELERRLFPRHRIVREDNLLQCSLNRLRCQRMTVPGFTKMSASFHPVQARANRLQRRRSPGFTLGLLTLRW